VARRRTPDVPIAIDQLVAGDRKQPRAERAGRVICGATLVHGNQRFLQEIFDIILSPTKTATKERAQRQQQRAQQCSVRDTVARQPCKHQSSQAIIIMPHAHCPCEFVVRGHLVTPRCVGRQRKMFAALFSPFDAPAP
jgi:hypothetical protein